MKRFAFLLAAIVILAACNREEKELNKDVSIPVSVMEVKPKSIEKYISTTGTVKPEKEVVLKSEINGYYILSTNPATGRQYALGDQVKSGTVIAELRNEEYEVGINLNSLELSLEISEQVYDKQKSLFEKGGVTLRDVKDAEIAYVNARNNLDDGKIRLQKMKITAPFAGIIVDLPYYTPGTRVDAGSEIAKIMDYSSLFMEINLAEKNISTIRTDQDSRIMNYTIPDDTLFGKITQISPAIDPETRSFKAFLNISNPDLLLRPGMFAKAEIVVASTDSAIVIPKEIILAKQKGNTVFVINKGLAEERIIYFGLENPNEVQVVSGLDVNDRLVIKGFETLRNRSKVKVVK